MAHLHLPAVTRAGDHDAALGVLFREEYRSLVRRAAMLLDEQARAEDVVQDAFVELHEARRHRPDPLPDGAPADTGVLLSEDRRAVLAALAQLPVRQRDCLVLRYYCELDTAEIASTLGISAGSVAPRLARAAGSERVRDRLRAEPR